MQNLKKELLEFENRGEFESSYLDDLPSGGVFVPSTESYSVGEMVLVVIMLPEIPDGLLIHGRVAWRRGPTPWKSALQPGIGLSFDEADPNKVAFLRDFFQKGVEDRRVRSRRIPVNLRVDFSAAGRWHRGKATNISREGLFISTDVTVPAGEQIALKLYLGENAEPDPCVGRVTRISRDALSPGLGLRMEYKTPVRRRKIYNFIHREEARLLKD